MIPEKELGCLIVFWIVVWGVVLFVGGVGAGLAVGVLSKELIGDNFAE